MEDTVDSSTETRSFLDTIGARILAVVVAAIAAVLLFMAHERYEGSTGGMMAGVDKAAFEQCVDERMAAFRRLADQAGFSDERRAEARRAARASANVVCAEQTRPEAAE